MQKYNIPNGAEMGTRMNQIRNWLDTSASQWSAGQRHLDEGTAERAYWHMGYLAALNDAQAVYAVPATDAHRTYASSGSPLKVK